MLKIIKVTGNSLSPFFLPGDYVLVWRSPRRFNHLAQGDFIVFDHVEYGRLIKKVIHNDPGHRSLQVEGIHPDSIPGQVLGQIFYKDILGKVIHRFHP